MVGRNWNLFTLLVGIQNVKWSSRLPKIKYRITHNSETSILGTCPKEWTQQILHTMFIETLFTKDTGCIPTKEYGFWYELCEDIALDNPVTEEQIVDSVTP